ncbi:MAG: hypothetical protein ACREN8_02115 [Candidatus Dormibacteraceae bacterium]
MTEQIERLFAGSPRLSWSQPDHNEETPETLTELFANPRLRRPWEIRPRSWTAHIMRHREDGGTTSGSQRNQSRGIPHS